MSRKPSAFPAPARIHPSGGGEARPSDQAKRKRASLPEGARERGTGRRSGPPRAVSRRPAAWGAPQPEFLPMTPEEMRALGWDTLDVLLINGDAYVDHPSFGVVLLGRWLTAHGFRVGLVAQPRWDTAEDIARMGRPRLFAGVSAGAVDSLLAHYTAFRKKRHDDAYTPGGRAGARPNRACIVYTNLVRRAFPGLPVVLGGIEASTRRVTHYDFWTDSVRRPILLDAKADLLIYGMGERAVLELARRLDRGEDWRGIPGTAWLDRPDGGPEGVADGQPSLRPRFLPHGWEKRPCMTLPSHAEILADPKALLTLTRQVERHVHRRDAWAVQPVEDRLLVMAPPAAILTTEEMDTLYALPFRRTAHPSYTEPIPAEEMLRTSITAHRGCGGGCSFCSLALHQGRRLSSRSQASLVAEAAHLAASARGRRGRGVAISDVGGPTANMWNGRCALDGNAAPLPDGTERGSPCGRTSCCYPSVCRHFETPQAPYVTLLRAVAAVPGVGHVRVASGVRADMALREPEALAAYAEEFTGGQLKLAPEHCAPGVLAAMRKPPLDVFERFLEHFTRLSRFARREQYVVPYLMSAFPGCTDDDMRQLARWLGARHWAPQQTQCFIPTPGAMATAMFYSGCNERGEPLFVARSDAERLRQHRILMPDFGRVPPSKRTGPSGRKHGRS